MAIYFAQDGWRNITVAFPVNILEISKINELAKDIKLNLLIESPNVVRLLSKQLKTKINVFLKIDIGYQRTGIEAGNFKIINEILSEISNSSLISFKGFLGHAGHSYSARSLKQIAEIHEESIKKIHGLKNKYILEHPDLIISVGDTPTCSIMEDFSMVDEIRPGNFVFYDLMQNMIGSCETNQIAVVVACPVVAIHEDRNEILVYGGGVHFSMDRIEDDNRGSIFGRVVENRGGNWGSLIEDMYLKKLSQEHGTSHTPKEIIGNYKEGDIIKVLPVHSCMTANLLKEYLTTEGEIISRL